MYCGLMMPQGGDPPNVHTLICTQSGCPAFCFFLRGASLNDYIRKGVRKRHIFHIRSWPRCISTLVKLAPNHFIRSDEAYCANGECGVEPLTMI